MTQARHGRRRLLSALFILTILAVAAAPAAVAQVLYGSVTGAVTDSSGGALAGVAVVATQQETGLSRETVTNAEGLYNLLNLPQGTYRLSVGLQGFKEFVRQGVPVSVNQITRVDAKLEVGQLSETIEVTSRSSLLQTDKGSMSTELRTAEITNLPLSNYRNYQKLYDLLPGATPQQFSERGHGLAGPVADEQCQWHGAQQQQCPPGRDRQHLPLAAAPRRLHRAGRDDRHREHRDQCFDAEQGMAGGAAVTVITKSGTNHFKGSAFEMHDNNKLESNNFFAPANFEQPDGSRNIFGGTLGGPVRRDAVFFFGSYEGTIERVGRFANASVPTAALRGGDFSETGTTIYNPFTGNPDGTGRQPFDNNQIPAGLLSQTAQRVLGLIPLPSQAGLTENYSASSQQRLDRHQFDAKVNWNRTAQHQLFAKYGHMDALVQCDQVFVRRRGWRPRPLRHGLRQGRTPSSSWRPWVRRGRSARTW